MTADKLWYACVKDEFKGMYVPLAGPFGTRAEAEVVCNNVYNRYCNERELWAEFFDHGVMATERVLRSIYGDGRLPDDAMQQLPLFEAVSR